MPFLQAGSRLTLQVTMLKSTTTAPAPDDTSTSRNVEPTPSGLIPLPGFDEKQARRLAPLSGKPAGTLVVHEIYRSLQGESTFVGLPCVFIRLTACHLRCVYCDTPHAFHHGETLVLDEVLARALALGDPLVEITGGEPLLQPEVHDLMTRLADAGRTVLLETSGAVDTASVDPRVRIILDLKTPASGEVAANVWSNVSRLRSTDEVKFVVCDRDDFEWACARIIEHRLAECAPVLMSPAFGRVNPTDLAAWILESRLPVRLQIQQHKILWDPDARGV
ncbi:MAG: radical SAM protein [Isosphaeraceae bacterium]